MNGLLLVAKSASTGEIVFADYDTDVAATIGRVCDCSDDVTSDDWIQYWGASEGAEWRVHMRRPVEEEDHERDECDESMCLTGLDAIRYAEFTGQRIMLSGAPRGRAVTAAEARAEVPEEEAWRLLVLVVHPEQETLAARVRAKDHSGVVLELVCRGVHLSKCDELASVLVAHPDVAQRELSARPVHRADRAA